MDTHQNVSGNAKSNGLKRRSVTLGGHRLYQLNCPLPSLGTLFLGTIGVVFLLAGGLPQPTHAQTLDAAIINQLRGDCDVLTGVGVGSAVGLSAELNSICAGSDSGPGPGASSGGGTGSAQTLGVSVENRRKVRLEGEQDKNGSTATQGASFNLGKGVSLFVSANIESLDRDVTTFADGFDSTGLGGTVGGDYRVNDQVVAGVAINYTNRDGDFDGGGNFSTNSYGGILFASFLPVPGFFADIAVGYSGHNYLVARPVSYVEDTSGTTISGTASSNTEGQEVSVRVLAGHDHSIGNLTFGPRVGLNFSHNDIDSYSETGGGGLALSYDDQDVTSLQGTLGIQGSAAVSTPYGVWVPQATADYVHEFENDQRDITVQFAGDGRATPTKFSFQTEKPVRNFFNLGIGTVLILPNGFQPFVNFRAMAGNEQFNNYAGTIGVRIEG
ncbi:MAG: autotransporter outer membrane beta-barrel domain-containing protein [Nitrospinae bacterium]|nr:autotransporter outer membrane beta-barrel domain-containing protein [Nitrospinota bacterium]